MSSGSGSSSCSQVTDQKVVYNVLDYLISLKTTLPPDKAAILEKAAKEIGETFGLSLDDPGDFKDFSYYPYTKQIFESGIQSLSAVSYSESLAKVQSDSKFEKFFSKAESTPGIFDSTEPGSVEYLQRHAKVIQKYNNRVSPSSSSSSNSVINEENSALAEEKKVLGNTALSAQDYHLAIAYYTEALDLCNKGPNSHVYYCNRAAAYEKLNEYAESVADCENAIDLCPEYSKSYARLGNSRFRLGNYTGAVEAFEEAVKREPTNDGSKKSLEVAKKKLEEENKKTKAAAAMGGGGGGNSIGGSNGGDMSQLFSDPNFNIFNNQLVKDVIDKFGTQPSMQNLMRDPDTMAMASKIFSNPQALQQVMQMAGNMNGDASSLQNLAALAGQKGNLGGGKGRKSRK